MSCQWYFGRRNWISMTHKTIHRIHRRMSMYSNTLTHADIHIFQLSSCMDISFHWNWIPCFFVLLDVCRNTIFIYFCQHFPQTIFLLVTKQFQSFHTEYTRVYDCANIRNVWFRFDTFDVSTFFFSYAIHFALARISLNCPTTPLEQTKQIYQWLNECYEM